MKIVFDDFQREIERTEPSFDPNYLLLPSFAGKYYSYYRLTTQYDGLKTIRSDQTIETRNILGKIIKLEEPLSAVVYYKYDANNNLIQVIDQTNTSTRFAYDTSNNQILLDETNLGEIHYEFNAFNELVGEYNANNYNSIKIKRDQIGRVLRRVESDRVTTIKYDQDEYSIGFVSEVKVNYDSNFKYTNKFTYDQYSREIKRSIRYEIESLNDTFLFNVRTQYDDSNRVQRVSYSDKYAISYCYFENGQPSSVHRSLNSKQVDCNNKAKSNAKLIWQANAFSSDGKILDETYGNGVNQTYGYDSTLVLRKIESYKNADFIRKLEYDYDYKRNLAERKYYLNKTNTILTLSDTFKYDTLFRLISMASYQYKTNKLRTQLKSYSYSYDSIGNMIQTREDDLVQNSKSINLYSYDSNKPQQIRRVGDDRFKYDSIGQVTKTKFYEIDWFSFRKAKMIRTNISTIEYQYGYENNRVFRLSKKNITKNSDYEITFYVDSNYEQVIKYEKNAKIETTNKYDIKIDSKRTVATEISAKNGEENTLFYSLNDITGSPDTILDENGYVLLRYKYESFGNRVVIFSNSTNKYLSLLNRGYTAHEHIDQTRLINMNGRIFDTYYLRFLSADFIQNYFKSQNLNRYAYCMNSPFRYSDPSGFSFLSGFLDVLPLIAIGVITGGLISLAVASVIGVAASQTLVGMAFTGFMVGAGSAYVTTYVATGSSEAARKSTLSGGISSMLTYGASNIIGVANPSAFNPKMFAADVVINGIENLQRGEKFFDGIHMTIISYASSYAFEKMTSETASMDIGDEYVEKAYNTMPTQKHKNTGSQGDRFNPDKLVKPSAEFWSGHEGAGLVTLINNVPGINAIATFHDAFQIVVNGPLGIRETAIGNVGSMFIPAAIVTLGSFYNQIECPECR